MSHGPAYRVHHVSGWLSSKQYLFPVDVAGVFAYTERRPPVPAFIACTRSLPFFGGLLFFYHVRHHLILLLNYFLAYKRCQHSYDINHILQPCHSFDLESLESEPLLNLVVPIRVTMRCGSPGNNA